MKAQWQEGGGRILLGDNTGGGAVMLRLIGFRCQIRLAPDLPESYPLRKSGSVCSSLQLTYLHSKSNSLLQLWSLTLPVNATNSLLLNQAALLQSLVIRTRDSICGFHPVSHAGSVTVLTLSRSHKLLSWEYTWCCAVKVGKADHVCGCVRIISNNNKEYL